MSGRETGEEVKSGMKEGEEEEAEETVPKRRPFPLLRPAPDEALNLLGLCSQLPSFHHS